MVNRDDANLEVKEEDEDKNRFVIISLVLTFNACCIDIHCDI